MRAIRRFFRVLAPEQLFMLQALEEANALELDYTAEAANLVEVGANMARHGFAPREVVVPQPVAELCTRRLLVMEMLPGPKLVDGLRAYGRVVAAEQGTTLEALEEEMRRRIEEEGVPPVYDGPSAAQIESYLRYMRTRDWFVNVGISLRNATLGLLTGAKPLPYVETTLPPNAPRIVDTLMRVHGRQLLSDGVFNADPHGGNFLLLPDDRIGLIDYGQTKRFTRNERLAACILFVALMRKDEQMLLNMCQVGGYKSKYGRSDVILKLMQFGYDSFGKARTRKHARTHARTAMTALTACTRAAHPGRTPSGRM